MLSIAFRSDWRYLTDHADEGLELAAARDYYSAAVERGEPAGTWWGAGARELGLDGLVVEEQMAKVYGELRHPETGERLGTAPRHYAKFEERLERLVAAEPSGDVEPERLAELTRQARASHREARTYLDMTFSVTKSISLYHAALQHAGRHEEAQKVWDAILTGVSAGLEYQQREAGYSRAGYHGANVAGRTSGKWVDGHEWTAALFRHHLSRDGDPQLHVHAAVLNRVKNEDGHWRSIDGQAVTRARAGAGAVAERVIEEEMARTLGVKFVTRADGKAREIEGVAPELADLFSSRRRAITEGVAKLAKAYEERHGRTPGPYTLSLMAEHVTLSSRAKKPDKVPARDGLLQSWNAKALKAADDGLRGVLKAVAQVERDDAGTFSPDEVAKQALEALEHRGVWTRYDLIAELNRQLPDHLDGFEGRGISLLLDEMADSALRSPSAVCLKAPEVAAVPQQLKRADGDSIYEPHGAERYTTVAHLNTEQRLVALASRSGAPVVGGRGVEKALHSPSLGPVQRDILRSVLTSGRRAEVLVGPAGAGKSYLVGQLSRIWEREVGSRVFAVTTAQNAAEVLRSEGITRASNVTRFLAAQRALADGRATKDQQREYDLGRAPLVIVDEASMMSAPHLAAVLERVDAAGGKVLVTGDDRQLSAIEAGGAMRLLVKEIGSHELDEVRRFSAEWEREASLRLRDGEADVLEDYDARGRFVDGNAEQMLEAAYRGYLADQLSHRSSLLVVPTSEQAAELSSRVRADLVGLGRVDEGGAALRDGNRAGRGDLVQTRKNDWLLKDRHGRPVINRDVYRVDEHLVDGSLRVSRQLGRDDLGRQCWGKSLVLPSSYVAEHVELAYASTVHAAQGRTVDTCHALVSEDMSREALYVALTRGANTNVGYVALPAKQADGLDRLDVLSGILGREATAKSATEQLADEMNAATSLARLGPVWSDVLADQGARHYRAVLAKAVDPATASRVANDEAAPALWRTLRSLELEGTDPATALRRAATARELGTADSPALVLRYRLEARLVTRVESRRAVTYQERTPDGAGPVLQYARDLARVMDRRVLHLGEVAATEQPAWARPLGPVPTDLMDRTDWMERAGWIAAYREQYGIATSEGLGPEPSRRSDPDRWQAWREAAEALGTTQSTRTTARKSTVELEDDVRRFEVAKASAPPFVTDQLRDAHLAARSGHEQAARLEAEAEVGRVPVAKAEDARVAADATEHRASALEQDFTARREWWDENRGARQEAAAARRELDRRGWTNEDAHADAKRPEERLYGAESLDEEVEQEVEVEAASEAEKQSKDLFRGWTALDPEVQTQQDDRGWTIDQGRVLKQ